MAKSKHQAWAALIFGGVLLAFLAVVSMTLPETCKNHPVVRLLGGALAALFGFFITGNLMAIGEGQLTPLAKVVLQLLTGIVLFLLVWLGWPSVTAAVGQNLRANAVEAQGSIGIRRTEEASPSE